MQLLRRSTRCPFTSSPDEQLVLLDGQRSIRPSRANALSWSARSFRRQHREAPLAFLFAPDIADDTVDGEGIAPLIQAPDDDIANLSFHGRSPHVPVRPPAGYAPRKFRA